MPSQTDLDQGGTYRQYQRIYLGPSAGWVTYPTDNVYKLTAMGTYSPVNGTTLITVSVNDAVTIDLWNPIPPANTPANSIPGPNVAPPVTIVDVGGYAANHPITINPPSGKTIIGLSSIQIASAFGGFILKPDLVTGNWTQNP